MSPKTKAPAPSRKLKDGRAEALQRMTKAELLKTVKTLDARVTKLLNRIAQLEDDWSQVTKAEPPAPERVGPNPFEQPRSKSTVRFPWEP